MTRLLGAGNEEASVVGYRSEEEQIDQIRRWWSEYGRSVIAGVIIALVGILGWQQWNAYQNRQELAAAAAYQALLADLGDDNTAAAKSRAEQLQSEHEGSVYAVLATFQMAGRYAERDDLQAAAEGLRWAAEHSQTPVLQTIARLRLARVLLGSGDAGRALEVAKPVPEGAFAGQFRELLGDIYSARSDRAAAIEAYRAALAGGVNRQRRGLIQAKLNDLGAAESKL